jgi:hypothetical protein
LSLCFLSVSSVSFASSASSSLLLFLLFFCFCFFLIFFLSSALVSTAILSSEHMMELIKVTVQEIAQQQQQTTATTTTTPRKGNADLQICRFCGNAASEGQRMLKYLSKCGEKSLRAYFRMAGMSRGVELDLEMLWFEARKGHFGLED